MRWTGHGHEAIRATHHKTLELTGDDAITERATCVIAVGARPTPVAPLAGPVTITVSAGGRDFSLEALANPNWDPRGPAVVRRSALRLPGTLATEATAAADDLPRELVAALADPSMTVDVRVEPIHGRRAVVLFALDATRVDDPRLIAELAVADSVVAEDRTARELLGAGVGGGVGGGPARRDGRVLVVAAQDLPGACVAPADDVIETVGLNAREAVAAACPSRARLLFATDGSDPRRSIRAAAATDRVVLRVRATDLADALALALDERGCGIATVAQEYGRPMRATPADIPDLASKADVFCCLHPAPETDTADPHVPPALDPPVRAAISALLTDGVGSRTAARALTELTGMPRRQAYDTVVAMGRQHPRDPQPRSRHLPDTNR